MDGDTSPIPSPPGDLPSSTAAWRPHPLDPETRTELRLYLEAHRLPAAEPPPALAERLGHPRAPAFRDSLLSFMRARGLADSKVCAAAGVDRRHYSKIRNDPDWRPSKRTVVSFALALRLSPSEADSLMRSAGYAFTESSDFDLICSFFLETGNWDPAAVNDALYAYGQPLVCGATLT